MGETPHHTLWAFLTTLCVAKNNMTSGRSNLIKGRIAAAHGWFNRIRQVAPMYTHLLHPVGICSVPILPFMLSRFE